MPDQCQASKQASISKHYHQAQRSIVEERRRHLAAASQAPRTAAPRAPQPIRLRRAARDSLGGAAHAWPRLLAVGGAPHVAVLHDLGPSRSLRSTSPPGSGLLAPLARVGLRCSAAGRERHKDARRPAARHSEWQAEQAPLC